MSEKLYFSVASIFVICLALAVQTAEVDAEVISSSKVVNLTRPFSDVEDFSRINSWTYKGLSWVGKYDDNQFNLTNLPPSDDKDVIFCFTRNKTSTLMKDFALKGPLTNANFTIKYYVRIFDQHFNMKGMLYDSENKSISHSLFDFDHTNLASENNSWVTHTASDGSDLVPESFTSKNFTVKLEFTSSSMVYDDDALHYQFVAVDELSLTGLEKIISLPQVVTTMAPVQPNTTVTVPPTAAPVVNKTTVANTAAPQVNVTSPAPSVNVTVVPTGNNETANTTDGNTNNNATEAPSVKPTAVANSTVIVGPTDASGSNQGASGSLSEEVERVAKAIWDAFYVFLALFCACLIALIILIYKARNSRDDAGPPPAVATYNPRTASYRLDSTGSSHYDNPGFRNEAV